MKISASILSIKDNLKPNVEKLDKTNIDFLHLDIMDGEFVPMKTWNGAQMKWLCENTTKRCDVHLMVNDVKSYVDDFIQVNPIYITFHEEAVDDVMDTINYIKSKGIGVGLSIKPNTKVDTIYNYLPYVDLVLVMSVEPGKGGQQFILSSCDKINKLVEYRTENQLNYQIEVDGGINDMTVGLVRNADIIVVGSYITNNDYMTSVNKLKS